MNKTLFFILIIYTFLMSSCGSSSKKSTNSLVASTTQNIEENLSLDRSDENIPEIIFEDSVEINETQYFAVKSPTECSLNNQNKFVYEVMHDSYLWNQEVDEVDYTKDNYNSPEKLLEEIKSTNDHFSFIMDSQTAESYFEEGKNDNFGFSLKLAPYYDKYALVIAYVYPNSPADIANIKRGDIIIKVDSQDITKESLDTIIAKLEHNNTIPFTFSNGGIDMEIKSITKESYSIKTILYSNYYINDSHKVGYIVFQDFIANAIEEINTLFTTFKTLEVNELILDLRYNGGGSEDVANHLASLIGGTNVSQKIFHHINLNEKYSQYNLTTYFEKYNSNALNLDRVFVITTESTCSASELIINALRASANSIEVIQVGTPTCGKPYGFIGAGIFCNKALYSINLESKNSDGDGGYVSGLSPTCSSYDDILKDFGDTSENSLNEALYYITNGNCSANRTTQKQSSVKIFSLPKEGFKRIMSAY